MKINKKVIVSSLASVMGLSLVGAVTGTVAWYQYSTRSTLAFVGTSVKNGANLKIKVGDKSYTGDGGSYSVDYQPDLSKTDISTYLGKISQNANLSPITTGKLAKNAALDPASLKTNPSYKDFLYNTWKPAVAAEYVQFTITLQYSAVADGTEVAAGTNRNKKVWLNNALFQQDAGDTTHGDLSDALRVHLHTSTANMLVSKKGGSTDVYGALDLNNDGALDGTLTWADFDSNTVKYYGVASDDENLATNVQGAYKIGDSGDGNVVEPTNTNGALSNGIVLGTTDNDGLLEVTVTIWLEGWQKLLDTKLFAKGKAIPEGWYSDAECSSAVSPHTVSADEGETVYRMSADWNETTYVGAIFDLGLEFICER